ncbi:cryptochrome/photolyase family protein [Xanthomonas phaseoli]|uniref:cryptochrome/photolyase family protein n=1 Tax=Xanthomonas phaseoli TaxID=1985254 RepID=UPI001ADA0A15|nr:deoxyribodipyrimidine photo-lyase [Xanthomonas phaseoli]MBO9851930.1 deoxyribodipyrimidine photo-lyase [Xanthomonas phaseoli pv. dieffenbachiae]MBO9965495.1 deoxyribodipyrimidine photo-lyase [Xanthomonas phaseoli pv. dieffenbachiae]MBO9986280.1 deoxyribodipyrimidine photo-lyase [Xanthomonas phaseoli pv. dieffenbachiae]
MSYAIVWFRRDLRLQDNAALRAALDAGHHPIPLYIDAPHEEGEWTPGAASRSWRHRALAALDDALRALGSGLVIRSGNSAQVLDEVIAQTGAVAVYWNRKYEPATQPRDAQIKRDLRERGIEVQSCNAALLFEPWQLSTQQGGPYKVFTPFWRNALTQLQLPAAMDAPRRLPPLPASLKTDALDTLQLVPSLQWDQGFWEHWQPGEAGAHEMLEIFIDGALSGYRENRDRPDRVGTSQLSPHLHFGEIAPWRIASALEAQRTARNGAEIDGYIRQLGWRDFAYHLLHHFPDTTNQNLNPRFAGFDWATVDPVALQAWQRGRTGIPIVDAGMRQLWHTGWMHNRVRMIVASFLCKHLRIHWIEGARWFWDTLIDADLANNTLGWQWVAGTGADAAPYFRVFNPVTQAEKFDPQATYITRWVPELGKLAVKERFAPWLHPLALARFAPEYPRNPIIGLAEGRDAALAAYAKSRA